MKEEIETTHFEHTFAVLGTNRAAETLLTKQTGRGVCAFHHNLSHGLYRVMSVKVSILESGSAGVHFVIITTTNTNKKSKGTSLAPSVPSFH